MKTFASGLRLFLFVWYSGVVKCFCLCGKVVWSSGVVKCFCLCVVQWCGKVFCLCGTMSAALLSSRYMLGKKTKKRTTLLLLYMVVLSSQRA